MVSGGTDTSADHTGLLLHQAQWTWMEPPRVAQSRRAKGRLSGTARERPAPPRYSLASKDLVGARSKGEESRVMMDANNGSVFYPHSGVLDISKWVLYFFFTFTNSNTF